MPKIVLELDDYCVSNLPFDQLTSLKEHYPNLKVTLFTIPYDMNLQTRFTVDKLEEWAELTKKFDWIEIAVHGFNHEQEEFILPYDKATKRLKAAEKILSEFTTTEVRKNIWFGPDWMKKKKRKIKLDIPYVKVFRAPRWQMSKEAYEAVRDMGYTVCTDRNQPKPDIPGMRQYRFNWSIEEPFPQDLEVVKGHGHIAANMDNDLHVCYQNLLTMPADAEFMFVSEYLDYEEKKNTDTAK